MNLNLEQLLADAVLQEASDLHLVPGHQPTLRRYGKLHTLRDQPLLTAEIETSLSHLCSSDQWNQFQRDKNLDFAVERDISGASRRFRANFFACLAGTGACFRVIPATIPSFAWSGFPSELAERLAHFRNGLILISGVTGAGKSTTLAMIIQLLHEEGGKRIITVEDPVEYVFASRPNSVVTQREVQRDVNSFADGLKYGLRQDPDVILVGEIRDRETAQMALSAAETGHLVFSTLHTRDAKGAISRYVDLFPQSSQNEIRGQLSLSLRAVISQHLLPSIDHGRQVLALEIMFNSNPIAAAIRFGKNESIDTGIVTGRADGMISLDESIKRLRSEGFISQQIAQQFLSDGSHGPQKNTM